jgi:hypothetical protein
MAKLDQLLHFSVAQGTVLFAITGEVPLFLSGR